ncbi:unnamed protein product [Heligmosomoides polygyrus]|uniref:Cation_ATPase_N domain-containing protein n=1 Tax=Heligmosomoides polygyrus TaxID=6339 RepID=A0A183GDG2_HELPZ|nr:unnamed protein product [Heligmosomoides polygyrus]
MTILKARFGNDVRKTPLHHGHDLTLNDLTLMLQRIFKIGSAEAIVSEMLVFVLVALFGQEPGANWLWNSLCTIGSRDVHLRQKENEHPSRLGAPCGPA